jgi:hypothetical protein
MQRLASTDNKLNYNGSLRLCVTILPVPIFTRKNAPALADLTDWRKRFVVYTIRIPREARAGAYSAGHF